MALAPVHAYFVGAPVGDMLREMGVFGDVEEVCVDTKGKRYLVICRR